MKVTTDACLFGAWVAEEVKSEGLKVKSVLDIGTGTGLLANMFAQKKPECIIDAIEIDEESAIQAKENIEASPWSERVTVFHDDAKTFPFTKKYDLIISNPPFYEKEIRSENERKNIAHHSNELSLKELLELIKNYLESTGNFFLLLPYKRNEEIKRLLKDHQLQVSKMIFVRQSVNHDFFRIFLKGNLKTGEQETEFDEMSIWNDKQQYTTEFTDLLKDYYLQL